MKKRRNNEWKKLYKPIYFILEPKIFKDKMSGLCLAISTEDSKSLTLTSKCRDSFYIGKSAKLYHTQTGQVRYFRNKIS